jgi:hypothetical protein
MIKKLILMLVLLIMLVINAFNMKDKKSSEKGDEKRYQTFTDQD